MDLDGARRVRDEAMQDLDRAEVTAWRAHVTAALLAQTGIVYAAADGDPCGAHLVAADGVLLGEVRTSTRGILQNWYGYPTGADEPVGPYPLPRGAALAVARSVLRDDRPITRFVPDGASPGYVRF